MACPFDPFLGAAADLQAQLAMARVHEPTVLETSEELLSLTHELQSTGTSPL